MTTVRLKDRDSKTVAVFDGIGKEINSVGVVLYKGDYFIFHSYEVQGISGELVLNFAVTNIMEVTT